MGILGELNQMAKAGQIEQFHAYLSDEINSICEDHGNIRTYIGLNDPRIAGAQRRLMHHNEEISIASFR